MGCVGSRPAQSRKKPQPRTRGPQLTLICSLYGRWTLSVAERERGAGAVAPVVQSQGPTVTPAPSKPPGLSRERSAYEQINAHALSIRSMDVKCGSPAAVGSGSRTHEGAPFKGPHREPLQDEVAGTLVRP